MKYMNNINYVLMSGLIWILYHCSRTATSLWPWLWLWSHSLLDAPVAPVAPIACLSPVSHNTPGVLWTNKHSFDLHDVEAYMTKEEIALFIDNHPKRKIFYRYSNEWCETLCRTIYSLKTSFIVLENILISDDIILSRRRNIWMIELKLYRG